MRARLRPGAGIRATRSYVAALLAEPGEAPQLRLTALKAWAEEPLQKSARRGS